MLCQRGHVSPAYCSLPLRITATGDHSDIYIENDGIGFVIAILFWWLGQALLVLLMTLCCQWSALPVVILLKVKLIWVTN